jgi:hypothetical protein
MRARLAGDAAKLKRRSARDIDDCRRSTSPVAAANPLQRAAPMMRSVLLAFACLGASISHAEDMFPSGATIKFNKLLLHEKNNPQLVEPENETESIWRYFNYAHCVCSQAHLQAAIPGFNEHSYGYELVVENYSTAIEKPLEIWTGTECKDELRRNDNCTMITTTSNVSTIAANNGTRVEIPIYYLMSPKKEAPGCHEVEQSAATVVLADSGDNGKLEYEKTDAIAIDTKAPPQPTEYNAVGGENAIELSWKPPASTADVAYYQALCAVATGGTAGKSDRPPRRYHTPRLLCGQPSDPFFTRTTLGDSTDPDGGDGSIATPEGFEQADPAFLCAETAVSTARGLRIEGLQNGVAYLVAVLVVDKYGNAQGTLFTRPIVPQPATDFWEDLHDQGSGVEGGFCLIAQTYGDGNPLTHALRSFRDQTLADTAYGRWLVDVYYATIGALDLHGSLALRIIAAIVLLPLVALSLLWHLLTLPGLVALVGLVALGHVVRRRRLRFPPRLAAIASASLVALVALSPKAAHAQVPYWEETEFDQRVSELPPGDPERVSWHAGIRLGPYVPGIDAQLGMPVGSFDGPYEQMFGGYSILPMLDIERFFIRNYGQLGAGVSIGYMGKKARAWVADSDPMDPDRQRTAGDYNRFRLFPFSLNATYRFTYLDDNYGVPLVPYARAGLAYYVWWVTAPNGDFAKSCKGPNTNDACPKTRAAGASLGFVGAVGLAIRAERIDTAAARSMRESGIEHAGFYAEYSIGKVDGFGSDKKLSVGDATWFAGVDFEF